MVCKSKDVVKSVFRNGVFKIRTRNLFHIQQIIRGITSSLHNHYCTATVVCTHTTVVQSSSVTGSSFHKFVGEDFNSIKLDSQTPCNYCLSHC